MTSLNVFDGYLRLMTPYHNIMVKFELCIIFHCCTLCTFNHDKICLQNIGGFGIRWLNTEALDYDIIVWLVSWYYLLGWEIWVHVF